MPDHRGLRPRRRRHAPVSVGGDGRRHQGQRADRGRAVRAPGDDGEARGDECDFEEVAYLASPPPPLAGEDTGGGGPQIWRTPISDHDLFIGESVSAAFPLLYPSPYDGGGPEVR